MGILNRLSNMVKAKANDALDNLENPIELLDQKIRDMEESLNDAKLSSAQVLGNVKEIEKKIEKAKEESKEYEDRVKLALNKGNEDLAKRALEIKLKADKQVEALTKSHIDASQKAKIIKENLLKLQKEIDDTRAYRDEAVARYNNAKATEQVNEVLAKVQTKSNSINIDDIERKIAKKEAMAEGIGELRVDTSLDDEFEKLNDLDLESELAKYKNQ